MDSKHRRSMVYINDNQIVESITEKIHRANAESFKFQLSTIEPLQYSRYEIDDHYNCTLILILTPTKTMIRKLSFTVILNKEYTVNLRLLFLTLRTLIHHLLMINQMLI